MTLTSRNSQFFWILHYIQITRSNQGVSHIQGVATKFGVIRTMQTFEGVVFKGVDQYCNWETISDYILKGPCS